ncbi:MAG: invasion associated locus B family protein [Proteobacteria bacterium]|nr:invasion associated locus B family protein [Pseudomonadota bacterium]
MQGFQKRYLEALLVVVLAVVAVSTFASAAKKSPETRTPVTAPASTTAPANTLVSRGWLQRCVQPQGNEKSGLKPGKKSCAIFERIDMQGSPLRLAEFVVGFREDKDRGSGVALGKIILPLGILLDSGISMKIEDGKPFAFRPSFCTSEGCITFVNLDRETLDSMKRAKQLSFDFKTVDGRDANLVMSLIGFEKALKELE